MFIVSPAHAGIASPYVIDFFPEGTQINNTIMLGFFGPGNAPNAGVGYEITDVRLVIEFTTAGGFDAANLVLGLVAPAGSNSIFLTGADLGWSGGGTFSEDLHFTDLNGAIGPGLWTFDVYGENDLLQYSGTFSDDTRWEIYLNPIPAPGAIAALGVAALVPRRRR
jgi:hypothetical protein